MQVVAHQLELAADVVVKTNYVLTHVCGLRDRRDVLVRAEVRFREGSRIEFPHGVLIDQVGGNRVIRERLSRCQTIRRVEGLLGGILRDRNYWRVLFVRWNDICEWLAERGKVGCSNSVCDARCTSLNLPAPFFVYEEERIVADVPAEIPARNVQSELRPRLARLVKE